MSPDGVVIEIHPGLRERPLAEDATANMPTEITAAALQAVAFPPVRWVDHPYIPQGLTLLAGKPKAGKSWLMLSTAIAVATGGYGLGGSLCTQGDVLYAALEDGGRRLKDRMSKLFGPGPWPQRLTFWTKMKRIEEGGSEQLRAWLGSHPDAGLVIVDVVGRVRSSRRPSETQYDADYRTMAAIKAIADETGVPFIAVHHVRKLESEDPLDAVSGTSGLTGAADTILVLKRETTGVTLFGRGRDIEEVEVAVEFDRETCRWRVLGSASEVRMSNARRQVVDAITEEGGPMTPAQIAGVTGQERGAVRRLVTKMARAGELLRSEGAKYGHPLDPR